MKILIVCPRLCHGGAERVAVELANGFAIKGIEVLFRWALLSSARER